MNGYEIIYYSEFYSSVKKIDGTTAEKITINIAKKIVSTPIGAAVKIKCIEDSVLIKQINNSDIQYNGGLTSTTVEMAFLKESGITLASLYSTDEDEWLLEMFIGSNLVFRGFIFTDTCREFYDSYGQMLVIKATDTLNTFDKILFVDTDGTPIAESISLIKVLARALKFSKLDLPISLLHDLIEDSVVDLDTNDTFQYLYPNPTRWLNAKGEIRTCKEVLENFCNLFSLKIFQKNGRWAIERTNAKRTTTSKVKLFDLDGNYTGFETQPTVRTVGFVDDILVSQTNQLEVEFQHAIKSYSLSYELENNVNLLTNSSFEKINQLSNYATSNVFLNGVGNLALYTLRTGVSLQTWAINGTIELEKLDLNNEAIQQVTRDKRQQRPGQTFTFGASYYFVPPIRSILKFTGTGSIESYPINVNADDKLSLVIGRFIRLNTYPLAPVFSIKITDNVGIVKYYNTQTKTWQTTLIKNNIVDNEEVFVSDYADAVKPMLVNDIKILSIGTVVITIYGNADHSNIQICEVSVLKPENEDNDFNQVVEQHISTTTKKSTVVPKDDKIYISDGLVLNPTLLKQNFESVKLFKERGGIKFLKAIEWAVFNTISSFGGLNLKVHLTYYGNILQLNDVVKFSAYYSSHVPLKKYVVIDMISYDYLNQKGVVNLLELPASGAINHNKTINTLNSKGEIQISNYKVFDTNGSTGNDNLTAPWAYIDINTPVSGTGSKSPASRGGYNTDGFNMQSGGLDIWEGQDSFGYLYKSVGATGSLSATFTAGTFYQNTNIVPDAYAKIGMMVRFGLAADSLYISVYKTANNYLSMWVRHSLSGLPQLIGTQIQNAANVNDLKIEKNGNNVSTFYKQGNTWILLGTTSIVLTAAQMSNAKIGFVLCAKSSTQKWNSIINNVKIDEVQQVTENPCGKIIGLGNGIEFITQYGTVQY